MEESTKGVTGVWWEGGISCACVTMGVIFELGFGQDRSREFALQRSEERRYQGGRLRGGLEPVGGGG